jgi:predicted lipid-binding transport protein (Tim44 family)
LDILIFAIIAAVLIYRLNAVLGTRQGDEGSRPNPFATSTPPPPRPTVITLKPAAKPAAAKLDLDLIDADGNKDGKIEAGLAEIAVVDPAFDAAQFVSGAKYAFDMIVTSYAKGDRAALKPLLSQKIYADFDHGIAERELLAHTSMTEIHRINGAHIVEAHLGGTMAYITVDFSIEQTTTIRDNAGNIVDDSGRPTVVEDIWTFTRDTRSPDPNWILIETRSAEKPAS